MRGRTGYGSMFKQSPRTDTARSRVLVLALALTLLVTPLASAVPGSDEPADGQPLIALSRTQTPYYIKTTSGEVVVHGDLSPAPPGSDDRTAEVNVNGPTFPRTTLTRIGVFEFSVDTTTDNIPLSIFGIEHVSIWAKANEDVTDAEFRVIVLRNGVEIADMRTVPADLGTTPTEQIVADIPPLSEDYRPGDLLELEVQYTAASRVGTGPAPDCIFLANSAQYPSRIEFMAVPITIDIADPWDTGEVIEVDATIQDTSSIHLEDLEIDLQISSSTIGRVDTSIIEELSLRDEGTHIDAIWFWYYDRTYTPGEMYEFRVVFSYGVLDVQYTISTFKWFDLPTDPAYLDTDGDGHMDADDAFPNNASEWADTDSDGYGDNCDKFPGNASEWFDKDGDGYGDNCDEFPANASEWSDIDGDGHGDNSDAFPRNATEWLDTDGDGHGDNTDAFPDDFWEWEDTDDDGVGDNSDVFPDDKDEWEDTDGDNVGDNGDRFPIDPAASMDTDGDGHPDEWNVGMKESLSTTGLTLDHYPYDQNRWEEEAGGGGTGFSTLTLMVLLVIIILVIVLAVVLSSGKEDE